MGSEAEYQRTDEDVLRELPFKLAPRVTKAGACSERPWSGDICFD